MTTENREMLRTLYYSLSPDGKRKLIDCLKAQLTDRQLMCYKRLLAFTQN